MLDKSAAIRSATRRHDPRSGRSVGAAIAAALYTHFLVTVAFIDTMAQLPLLSPFAVSLGAGATLVGVILGAYSLVNMVGNVVAGPVIDRVGRRVTLVAGMLVAGCAVAAYALVTTPWQLFGLRLAHGAGGAILIPAAYAYVGDRSVRGSVGRSMGYAGAAVALAALIGPALGGMGRDAFGIRPVFLGIGALLVATAVSAIWLVHDGTGAAPFNGPAAKVAAVPPRVRAAIGDPDLRYAYLSVFSLSFTMGVLAYTFPLTMQGAGFSAARTGSFFSIFSAAAILVLVLPTNRLSDRFGRGPLVTVGSVAIALALAFLTFSRSVASLTAVMALYGAGYGTVFPSACAIVVDRTAASNRGTAFGIFYASFSLGVTIGPVAAGLATGAGLNAYWLPVGVLVIVRLVLLGRRPRATPAG